MKIRLRRSVGKWTRGQELEVPKDISKPDADYYVDHLKLADIVGAKGKAVPRAGDLDPSKALPSGGPGGSESAASSSPAVQAPPAPIGTPPGTRRRRAAPGS